MLFYSFCNGFYLDFATAQTIWHPFGSVLYGNPRNKYLFSFFFLLVNCNPFRERNPSPAAWRIRLQPEIDTGSLPLEGGKLYKNGAQFTVNVLPFGWDPSRKWLAILNGVPAHAAAAAALPSQPSPRCTSLSFSPPLSSSTRQANDCQFHATLYI